MPTATLIIRIQSRPGRAAELKHKLLELSTPTRNHARCLHCNLQQSLADDNLFLWYENWLDRDSLAENLLQTPPQKLFCQLDELIASPPEISLWERIR